MRILMLTIISLATAWGFVSATDWARAQELRNMINQNNQKIQAIQTPTLADRMFGNGPSGNMQRFQASESLAWQNSWHQAELNSLTQKNNPTGAFAF